MDDKQTKLLIGAIALVVVAAAVWFFFGLNGPRSGVADLPRPKSDAPRAPAMPPPRGGGAPSAD